jgi:NodT family efflux transporter outer membrane factor (OMF) lipoprotein
MTRSAAARHSAIDANIAAAASACVLLVVLVLCGCASVRPRGPEPLASDIPAAWSSVDAATLPGDSSLVAWWSRFDDPLLTRLVADALQANTTLTGAQAALRQARALREVAAAALFPTLTGSASAQRSSGSNGNGAAPTAGRTTTNSFQAGLDANWELDVFGANRSALDASEATARASAASLGDVQVSVAAEVALGYITWRNAQARLTIANDNLASQQETLQITAWRQQAGLVTALEVEQARAAAEQTGALVPALQTAMAQARHALAVLVGRPPAALTDLLAGVAPVPQPGDELALLLPAETLRQRADVRSAEHQVAAAQARVQQAEAARLPSFAIGGSLGLNALTLGALSNGASVVTTLLGSVSLPIFDGGAARAQVDAQQAALEQAQTVYRAAVLLALKDVEDALVALRGDRVRLVRLGSAADAAASAALMARQRYSSGLVDFQTVLETQRTQLGTQDSVANARADVSSDHVRLYKALGGGWEPDTNNRRASTP